MEGQSGSRAGGGQPSISPNPFFPSPVSKRTSKISERNPLTLGFLAGAGGRTAGAALFSQEMPSHAFQLLSRWLGLISVEVGSLGWAGQAEERRGGFIQGLPFLSM